MTETPPETAEGPTLHRCMQDGQPGWQFGDGVCHTFEPRDDNGRRAALRAAIREGLAQVRGRT